MSKAKVNTLHLMRQEIRSGEWSDMDVHYACCQIIATFCEHREVEHEEAMHIVEQIKDEIDEMDCYWLDDEEDDE